MKDTPETKMFKTRIRGIDGDKHWVPAGFAEILERERDKARRERDEALLDKSNGETVTMTISHYDCIISKLDKARTEADYYKAKYESTKE
jgi:hypothetical protein